MQATKSTWQKEQWQAKCLYSHSLITELASTAQVENTPLLQTDQAYNGFFFNMKLNATEKAESSVTMQLQSCTL
jgi:hypothetical protein